jgi:sigma-B regulation protein RsbU (phosphoserine phosphatase)
VVALLVVEPRTGDGVYVSAGAEPLLVVRAGGEAEAVERSALPLGVERVTRYAETPVHLEPGDTALRLTDGITEARTGGELLGYPRMVRLAQHSLRASSLQRAGETIVAGARAFARGPLSDDVCLLLARRR